MKKTVKILTAFRTLVDKGHYAGKIETEVWHPDGHLMRKYGPDEEQPSDKKNTVILRDTQFQIKFTDKICKTCGCPKPIDSFYAGRQSCVECYRKIVDARKNTEEGKVNTSTYRAAYYLKNRELEKKKNLARYHAKKGN